MNQLHTWGWEQTEGFTHSRQALYQLNCNAKPIMTFYNVVMSQINLVAIATTVKGLKTIMYLGKLWHDYSQNQTDTQVKVLLNTILPSEMILIQGFIQLTFPEVNEESNVFLVTNA